jgi:excisionase family DNA binding protein
VTRGLLNVRQAADRLLVHPETVLRWYRRGEFEGVAMRLPGGAIRFFEDQFEAWLEERAAAERGDVPPPARRRPAGNLASVTHPDREEV